MNYCELLNDFDFFLNSLKLSVSTEHGIELSPELSLRHYHCFLESRCYTSLNLNNMSFRLHHFALCFRKQFYIGAITAGTARCRSSCHGPPTTRPCVFRPARIALVSDQAEDRVQAVPARPQVTHWSFTSIHKWPANVCCRRIPGRPALRTASRGDFIVPRTNRKFGDRAFCVAAPRVWNRLPADLKQLRSTQTFRRHLKTFLFAACYWATINRHSWTM